MHQDRNNERYSRAELAPTEREDARVQAAALSFVLAEYPGLLTEAELALELLGDAPEFSEQDAYQRAIDCLIRGGLLHRQGVFIMPTRAARHCEELELG
jgi:hypothetical protein